MARFFAVLNAIESGLIALLAALALGLACLAMAARYVMPSLTVDWTFELIIFTVIWATFLAGARLAGSDGHVRVDTLLGMIPEPWRLMLVVFGLVVSLMVALFLLWSGSIVVEEAYRWDERTTSTLRLPLWIYYLSLPVGGALLSFHLLERMVAIVHGSLRGVEDDRGR